jgi:hypothetical protein
MIRMKRRIVSVYLVILFFFGTLSFALTQPLLVVKESQEKKGYTYLALVLPDTPDEIRLTDDMFRISFPRVCSETGMIGFTHHTASMKAEIYLIPPAGKVAEKVMDSAILEGFSPDGKYLLYTNASASPSLWALDLNTRQSTRLTTGLIVSSATWSPNGQQIAFSTLTSSGRNDLYLLKWNDKTIERLTQTSDIDEYYPVFTSSSEYLAYMSNRTGEWLLEYFILSTKAQYQTKIQGMYPLLSDDDAWTVVEEDDQIVIWKTSGELSERLTRGLTPAWISDKAASRFLQVKEPATPGKILVQATIDENGGIVSADGMVRLTIPAGLLTQKTELTIRQAEPLQPGMQLFEYDMPGIPELFPQWVTIDYPIDASVDPKNLFAIEEISEGIWWVVPSEYDTKTRTLRTKTAHFSKKGYISEISSSDIRKIFSGAVGAFATAGTIIVVTGSTAITLPVLGAVAAGAVLFGATEIANPLMDRAYEIAYGLDHTIALGDQFNISWTGDTKSRSYLHTDRTMVCIDRLSKKILLWMDEPNITPQQRAAAMTALFPGSTVALLQLPKTVITLAAEAQEIKEYYTFNGYACPPSTDIWIHTSDACGYWDGTKLHVDSDYVQNNQADTKASRRVVVAHEYWHSVYQFNQYQPSFPWLDECLATTFESEALSDADALYYHYGPAFLPLSERFYDMYPAEKLAQTLRTGFVLDGTEGFDADRVKRGYHLWAWGKFLLHTQGHDTIRSMLKNTMDSAFLSTEFSLFCRSLLIKDLELEEDALVNVPKSPPLEYITRTGWPFLNVSKFVDSGIITVGNAGAAYSAGVSIRPSPLSMTIRNIKNKAPAVEAPLVVRRSTPDKNEDIIALHPTKMDAVTSRRSMDDVAIGTGYVVVPNDWVKSFGTGEIVIPIAFIHKAVKQTWKEYFGYGDNPVYCYFLLPPKDLQIIPSGTQLTLRWTEPEFGPGLSAERCLKGYRLYVQKGNQSPVAVQANVKSTQTSILLDTKPLEGYDRLGIACEDLYATYDGKTYLLSPIAWIEIKTGKGLWVLQSEIYNYQLGREYFDAEIGSTNQGVYEDGCFAYRINMGAGQARTSVVITAKDTLCSYWSKKGETSKFLHTWTPLPKQLTPGQTIKITLGTSDDGCAGQYSPMFNGETKFEAWGYDSFEVEAGGMFGKKIGSFTWVDKLEKSFEWVVPQPDSLQLSSPERNPMSVTVSFTNDGSGVVTGSYTYRYVFRAQ